MVQYQKFNKKIKAWVKFAKVGNKNVILNVKQINPTKKFTGVKIRK